MAYDYQELLALNGNTPHMVYRTGAGGFGGGQTAEIVYTGLSEDQRAGAVEWLRKNRLVVRDLVVPHDALAGVWRTVRIESRPVITRGEVVGVNIVQILAFGYYREFYWNMARAVSGDGMTGNDMVATGTGRSDIYKQTVTAVLTGVDPARAPVIARSFCSVPVVNDIVIGEDSDEPGYKCEGPWFVLGATHSIAEDGSSTVAVKLARTMYVIRAYRGFGTRENEERYYVYEVPLGVVQSVIDEWTYVGGSPRKGAFAYVEGGNTEAGTANLVLGYIKEETEENSETVERETCFETLEAKTDRGLAEEVEAPEFVQGKIVEVSNRKSDLGKITATVETRTAKLNKVGDVAAVDRQFESDVEVSVRNQTAPIVEEIEGVWVPTQQVAGTIVEQRATRNEYCLWDNQERKRTAKPNVARNVADSKTAFETAHSERIDNQTAPVQMPSGVPPGKVVEVASERNEFGLFNNTVSERVAVEQIGSVEGGMALPTEVQEFGGDTNTNKPSVPEEQEPGSIVNVRGRMNASGKWDVERTTRTAIPNVVVGAGGRKTVTEDMEMERRDNQSVPVDMSAAQQPGEILEGEASLNEFGLWTNTRRVRTAKEVLGHSEWVRREVYESVEGREDKNRANVPDLSEQQPGDGETIEVEYSKNDYGVTDVRRSKRLAALVPYANVQESDDAFTRRVEVFNSGVADESELEGELAERLGIQDLRVLERGLEKMPHKGRFRERIACEVPKEGLTPQHVVAKLHDGTTVERTMAQHEDPNNLPAWAQPPQQKPAVGFGVSISRRRNRFGGLTVEREDTSTEETRIPATGAYVIEDVDGPSYYLPMFNVKPEDLQARLGLFDAYKTTHNIQGYPQFRRETGTFDVMLIATPKPGRVGGGSGAAQAYQVTYTSKTYETVYEADTREVYVIESTWTVYEIQSPSLTTVRNYLNDNAGTSNITPLGTWGFRGESRVLVDVERKPASAY